MTLATRPGASARVAIRNTTARAGISMGRRGRTSFTTSAMKGGAAIAVIT
jgi:hypothetical protein